MLELLKRWLGWDRSNSAFDFSDLEVRRPAPATPAPAKRRRSAAATPRQAASATAPPAPRPAAPPAQAATSKPPPAPAPKPKKPRDPRDVLDNPRLSLDRGGADGFDPYNTGAFNRSQSWEKIGRKKR